MKRCWPGRPRSLPRWSGKCISGTTGSRRRCWHFSGSTTRSSAAWSGVSRSKSSYYKYRSVYRLLAAYVRERCRRADIPFRELDKRFLAGFHQYIARESPHKKNTAWVYMIAFKHILMLARSRDLLSADLFAGYRLRSEFVTRDYLTETEIRRLMLLAPTDRTQRLVLDAFLFSCFTGLSYIDIRQLKPANIRYTQGQLWIGTTRRKTGSEVYVRLFAVPNAILSRYLTDAADEPIFALPSNGWCNACLRRLLPEAGIVRPITFHVARHTFATTITLSQGVAIETISKLLGHRNIRTTQIYAAVTHAKLEGDMERLLPAARRLLSSLTTYIYGNTGSPERSGAVGEPPERLSGRIVACLHPENARMPHYNS